MAEAEPTEAKLPFGMGEVDLTSMNLVFTAIALTFGFALYHMTDGIGERLANWLNSVIGSFIGQNPATGNSGPEGV